MRDTTLIRFLNKCPVVYLPIYDCNQTKQKTAMCSVTLILRHFTIQKTMRLVAWSQVSYSLPEELDLHKESFIYITLISREWVSMGTVTSMKRPSLNLVHLHQDSSYNQQCARQKVTSMCLYLIRYPIHKPDYWEERLQ